MGISSVFYCMLFTMKIIFIKNFAWASLVDSLNRVKNYWLYSCTQQIKGKKDATKHARTYRQTDEKLNWKNKLPHMCLLVHEMHLNCLLFFALFYFYLQCIRRFVSSFVVVVVEMCVFGKYY